jgi:hypothetical protein
MRLQTAGELIVVDTELAWAGRLIARATGRPAEAPTGLVPSVQLRVQARTDPFPLTGLRPVTRDAYTDGRQTVLHNACGSGFDLLVVVGAQLAVTARYRPRHLLRATNRVLARRFAQLAGQVLVHYPVLWRAGWRGRVPLHGSVFSTAEGTPLLAGPAGVGKSTVLVNALAAGAVATSDNLCCADAALCYGLAEPVRMDTARGRHGRRTSHDRVEQPLGGRVSELAPDRLVVLERGPVTDVCPLVPAEAARALVAGTYAAGELRRYWSFAATLALATGWGPAHPPIAEIAAGYAERLPCRRVRVGDGDGVSPDQLCGIAVPS